MNVSMTQEMETWVQRKVESGLYTSASEVVREALRTLYAKETQQNSKLASLREALQLGSDAADQGDLYGWDESVTQEVQQMGRKRRSS